MLRISQVAQGGGGLFVDEAGNTRLLRGMAIAFKAHPFIPQTDSFHPVLSFADEDIAQLERCSLNVIRLAVPWAAVQPFNADRFDEDYLTKVLELVRRCSRSGIYVIIEAHQDLYAAEFGGNGMPAWSITRDAWTLPFPLPIRFSKSKTVDPSWGKYYVTDACSRAFFGLYTDHDGVQSCFVRYWEKLATLFKDEKNVVGYELLNEPFVGSRGTIGALFGLLDRKKTEKDYLVPLYDRLTKAIRAIDTEALIFYEPCTGGGGNSGDGFRSPPIGDGKKSVMAFHSYGPNLVDGYTMSESIEKHLAQVGTIGGGAMLTEFDCEYDRGEGRIREVMEMCDLHLLCWIGWQMKEFINITGSPPSGTFFDPLSPPSSPRLRNSMLNVFSRPYPSSVAGTLHSYRYDFDARKFECVFSPRQVDRQAAENRREGDRKEGGEDIAEREEDAMSVGKRTTTIAINSEEVLGYGEWIVALSSERGTIEENDEGVRLLREERRVMIIVQDGWDRGRITVGLSLASA